MALMAEKEKTEMFKREVRLHGNGADLYVFYYYQETCQLKGLGRAILGNFSTDQIVIE